MREGTKTLSVIITVSVLMYIGCAIDKTDKTHRLAGKLETESFHQNSYPLATLPVSTSPTKHRQIKPPFTLEQCIEIALSNNPDIGSKHFDVLSAKAQQAIAEGERWPEIELQSSYKHYLHNQRLVQPRYANEPGVWDNDNYL